MTHPNPLPDSVAGDEVPTSANTIAEIKAWLDVHSITYSSALNKDDLLALVAEWLVNQ